MPRASQPSSTEKGHPLQGRTTSGKCLWCYRPSNSLVRGWDGIGRCPDRKACQQARDHHLIVAGRRPRSWYERLATGDKETLKEARKADVDVSQLLQDRAMLEKEEADKVASVALPFEEELPILED